MLQNVDSLYIEVVPQFLGLILAQGRKLLFYDVEDSFLRKALDDTHQRNPDHPPPEIVIDPVEEIGNRSEDVCHCLFSQVDFS